MSGRGGHQLEPHDDERDFAFDIVIMVFACATLLLVTVALWGTYGLYGQRKKLYLQKRYHKTLRHGEDYPLAYSVDAIFGLNLSIIYGMCMSMTTLLIRNYSTNDTLRIITESASYGPWYLIMLFLNVKNWNLFFRFKLQHYAMQSEWQKIINPDETRKRLQHNWYIRNNKTWGNLLTVYLYFGTFHLILLSAIITLEVLEDSHSHSIQTMMHNVTSAVIKISLFVLPFILYLVIEAKTPSFNDVFFIHWESRMQAICTAVLIVIFLCSDVMDSIIEVHYPQSPLSSYSLSIDLIFVMLQLSALFALLFVSTFMVIRKNNPKEDPLSLQRKSSFSFSPTSQSSSSKHQWVTLEQILETPKALNLFMIHLSKEYSTELLLSYIEMDQFQKHVLRTVDAFTKMHVDLSDADNIPDITVMDTIRNVPKSKILQELGDLSDLGSIGEDNSAPSDDQLPIDEKTMRQIKKMAHLLHNKYIREGAEFEINICWQSRSRMMKQLGDQHKLLHDDAVKLSHLINMYQQPKEEMKQLLLFSLNRMKAAPEGAALSAVLDHHNGGRTPRSPSRTWG